ncbi:MAG: putative Fe-S cluster assembly protein SufT [Verrucomicrobiota bacterium]
MNFNSDPIKTTRKVTAIQIPSGISVELPEGSEVTITQSLGGTYTVLYSQGLARVDGKDADALGLVAEKKAPVVEGDVNVDEKAALKQLRLVFDPEIPVNIVDLGLVYETAVEKIDDANYKVNVKMTLTAPGCGMGPAIAADAQKRLLELPGVTEANVDLTWDPPWNQNMVSEVGRMQLGWA